MKKVLMKLLNTFLCTFIIMYAVFVLAEQQSTLASFKQDQNSYNRLIQEEKIKTEELNNVRGKLSTADYIEEVAREKLGLVMPYEIIFIDANL